jgi:hypothetical protein
MLPFASDEQEGDRSAALGLQAVRSRVQPRILFNDGRND